MDLDQLKQILELVRTHELSEFEIEQEGLRLKIRKDAPGAQPTVVMHQAAPSPVAVPHPAPASAPSSGPASANPASAPGDSDPAIELAVVQSPIVGTFFRSPEPSAPAFVQVGF